MRIYFVEFSIVLCGVLLLLGQGKEHGSRPRSIDRRLPEITQYVLEGMQKTGVPGVAIRIVYRNKVIYLPGFGVRKIGEPEAIDAQTIFQLASVSKPIASTLVAALVGDGLVSWDDRIADKELSATKQAGKI